MEKKYWQSLEDYKEYKKNAALAKTDVVPEFSIEGLDESEIAGTSSRRDFLKMLGFSVGAVAMVSSCQMPVRKAIPLLNHPEDLIPGVPNFYASTFYDGIDYCSILVKTRENRPIKIEGNALSPISKGGTSARVQASVLNLYDDARLKFPLREGEKANWEVIDKEVIKELTKLRAVNKKVVLLTSSIISPSTKALIEEFTTAYPNIEWISYDPVSMAAIRKANEINFGKAVIPSYQFDRAKVIVGFNADFLGTWLLPVTYTKQYAATRRLSKDKSSMSRLYQYESWLSLTGANADYRYGIKPSDEATVLLNLYNKIAKAAGKETVRVDDASVDIEQAASDLIANKGKSLVVSGTNDLEIQLIVNAINQLLDSFGNTIDLTKPLYIRQGDEGRMQTMVKEMNEGAIAAMFIHNVNPAYDYHDAAGFASGMEKVHFRVSFADTRDETARLCEYIFPNNNYLESWDDAEPIKGFYSMTQPTVRNIFDTRQFQDSLLVWLKKGMTFDAYMEKHWMAMTSSAQMAVGDFSTFWNRFKHDGVFQPAAKTEAQPSFQAAPLTATPPSEGMELVLYEKIAIGTGKYTNNPWLLEMPDPISTATWDNYLAISPKYAEENGLEKEDVVRINNLFEIPVLVQPGQPYGTASLALGFGRKSAGKAGNNCGQNAFPLAQTSSGFIQLAGTKLAIEKMEGKTYPLALTQMHHDMEDRPIVRETTLEAYQKDPSAGNELHKFDEEHNTTLYKKIDFDGIQWGMTIDLTSCTGCANCVIACQAENNVPVIGKEQVKNRRIMHWMRIDRYFSKDEENPEVHHMPVMCQHCDNAPCENVCPVAATNHSNEGLNQMAYNRCIGTRYCINNCPYKVRRFNWFEFTNNNKFDYNMNSDLGRMVLNPDVIVRQRGVVEKCSLCVQRLQEKKLTAKMENRALVDGEVQTACSQSCPTEAIQFGNLLDKDSVVSVNNREGRMYHLLEHLHTLPSTSYLTKVKNTVA